MVEDSTVAVLCYLETNRLNYAYLHQTHKSITYNTQPGGILTSEKSKSFEMTITKVGRTWRVVLTPNLLPAS